MIERCQKRARWSLAIMTGSVLMATSLVLSSPPPTPAPIPSKAPPPSVSPQGPAGGTLRPPANVDPAPGAGMAQQVIVAEPAVIELGEFSTSETKPGSVTLRNTGDKAVTIMSAKASCGCTTADFKKNTVLAPGEETTVTVRMRGGPTARVLNKTVTFTIEGYPQLKVPVKGKSIAYVKMTPDRVGINDNPDGKIVFESIDEQPFKLVNIQPSVLKGDMPEESKSKHEVEIDWDAFLAEAKNSRVTFYFDHPKATQHFTIVKLDREQREQLRSNANAGRVGANSGKDGKIGPGLTASGKVEGAGLATPSKPRVQSMANLVRRGTAKEVADRIDGGESVSATDDGGTPLLAIAAKEGNVEMMTLLLDKGADVNQTDKVGRTALMHAGTSKNPVAVRLLIEREADVNMRDSFIGGALAWTSGFGTSESVQDLLDAGAQVGTKGNATGYTPLVWASGFGDYNSIPLLLEAGSNIEATDGIDGSTPLMHASKTGKIEGMQILIDRRADVNARNLKGETPLLACASHANGTVDKVELLVASGADLSAKDNGGRSALDLAKQRTDGNSSAVLAFLSERMPAEGAE